MSPRPALRRIRPVHPVLRTARRRRVAAAVVAVLVATAVQRTVSGAEAARSAWGGTVDVAVARHAIAPGEPLGPAVATVERPRSVVPAGALRSVPTGRRAARSIAAGEELTLDDLAGARRGPLASRLPVGRAGVTVTVRPDAPEVRPGDRVAVVGPATGGPGPGWPADEPTDGPVPVAEDAEVLGVDGRAVTLAVRSAQAAATAAASVGGEVTLVVLR